MLCASDNLQGTRWVRANDRAHDSLVPRGARHSRLWLRAMLLAAFCVWIAAATAQTPDVTDGRFLIVQANTETTTDVLLLDAEIVYGLSPGAVEALNNGVPLLFETQIELDRSRRFLPDPNIVKLVQRSQLTYHALTQRFIVLNFNSSEQTSHVTLSDALKKLGQLQDLPIIDLSLLDPRATYSMRMRSVLDTRSYAAPLRMLAALFQVDDWRLESPWERWLVTL